MPIYRSAQGRQVDMTQLAAKNEKVRAVGNMNVNARGDVIDSNNKIVKDNTNRVKNSYARTVNQTGAIVHHRSQPSAVATQQPKVTEVNDLSVEEQDLFDDNDEDIKK